MHHCLPFTDYKTERPKAAQLESVRARICLCILSTASSRWGKKGEFKSANCNDYECLYTAIFLNIPSPSTATHPYNHSRRALLCQTKQTRPVSVLAFWPVRHYSGPLLDTQSLFLPLWLLLLSLRPSQGHLLWSAP